MKKAWIKFVTDKELGPWNCDAVTFKNMMLAFYAGYRAGQRSKLPKRRRK